MYDEPLEVLSRYDAWARLRSQSVGRLALCIGGSPRIFPVNYLIVDDSIYVATGPGQKATAIGDGVQVAFEADDWSGGQAWSAVATGVAKLIDDPPAGARAVVRPWAPGTHPVWIEIEPDEITGRRFDRAAR